MSFFKVKLRRIRFWWRLSNAYFSHYRWWILGVFSSILVFSFLIYKLYPVISQSNVVNIGYIGNYSLESIPSEFLNLATGSLVGVDPAGKPVPNLASHWTVSEDGKTYVIFLKDNLKWHDGSPVNAKDISIAISNVSITALNNKAIQFTLPNPFSSFLLALDKPVFKSNSFYGTGNFRITGIDQMNNIVKKISLTPNSKNLPRVNIKFYPTEFQAQEALKMGDIKSATVTEASQFEKWPNLNVSKDIDYNSIVTIFFNNNDQVLGSKELREALIYAINRSDFDGVPSESPISPQSWAFNGSLKKYEYNTSKAKELLIKSGVKNPSFTLSYTPQYKSVAEQIKKDWAAIGINVTIKDQKTLPKDFQAFLTTRMLSPDPDQYALWHSSQKDTNITNYRNVKIDKLLEDARTTSDESARKDLYADFQRFLIDDAPAAFLYHPYKYHVTYKNVLNLISKLPK